MNLNVKAIEINALDYESESVRFLKMKKKAIHTKFNIESYHTVPKIGWLSAYLFFDDRLKEIVELFELFIDFEETRKNINRFSVTRINVIGLSALSQIDKGIFEIELPRVRAYIFRNHGNNDLKVGELLRSKVTDDPDEGSFVDDTPGDVLDVCGDIISNALTYLYSGELGGYTEDELWEIIERYKAIGKKVLK